MATTEQRSGFRLPWATESEPGDGQHADSVSSGRGTASTGDPTTPEATVTNDTATIDPRITPPSESGPPPEQNATDTRAVASAAGAVASHDPEAVPVAAPPARRTNPLVAGLVKAMRDAAQVARDDSLARVAAEAKARIEAIHAASSDGAAALRHTADQDVAAIREWAKAEAARVRQETDERIAARRRQLDIEVEDHAAQVEHRIEQVQAIVGAFDASMELFFRNLLAEEDPARVAGFAEQLPEPPSFDDANAMLEWKAPRTLDSSNAAAAEADALSGLDDAEIASTLAEPPSVEPPGPRASVEDRMLSFAVPLPEPEPTSTSVVSVTGLSSVAGIAGFKRAVSRAPGVSGVAVSSGPSGDFAFTVQHGQSLDLAALVGGLDGFAPVVTAVAEGALSVSVSEPEAARGS